MNDKKITYFFDGRALVYDGHQWKDLGKWEDYIGKQFGAGEEKVERLAKPDDEAVAERETATLMKRLSRRN